MKRLRLLNRIDGNLKLEEDSKIKYADVAFVFVSVLGVGTQKPYKLLVSRVRRKGFVDRTTKAHVADALIDARTRVGDRQHDGNVSVLTEIQPDRHLA